jgi:galactokinase
VLPAERAERLRREFAARTGRPPVGIWSAPGRANLIGEHLDYNGGWVLPFAIGLRTAVAVGVRDDDRIRCWSLQDAATADISLDDVVTTRGWSSYVIGTVWAMRAAGAGVRGLDIVVDGDVPLGGGLSSSAALECAVAVAANDLSGGDLDRLALAQAGQRAERDVVGAPVGIMDQMASLLGREGHGLLLDCATLHSRGIALPLAETETRLLVVDTGTRHDHACGGYADRRRECETAAAALGVDHLALADADRIGEVGSAVVRRRARHVVSEQQRVHDVVHALQRTDMAGVGAALTASHASLRDDFEISVPELDGAVDAALGAGALGARLTGGGFGGCVLALVPEHRFDATIEAVSRKAADQGWPAPRQYDGRPRDGARRET